MRHKHAPVLLASYFLSLSIVMVMAGIAGPGITPAFADSPALVRIIHASPAVGSADIFLDGQKILSDFGFGTVTNYVSIPPGPHKVQIALIGKGVNAAVLTQTLSVSPGVAYTVAATGDKSSDLALQVFVDDNQIATGATKVRFYHLSPGTGTVSVSTNGNVVVQGLNYEQASSYITLQPGAYTFNANVTQPSSQLPVSVALKANMVTSVFAVGVFNGTPKIEFVSSEVSGVPGLPNTGSDPTPLTTSATPSPMPFWLPQVLLVFSLVALFLISWSLIHYRIGKGFFNKSR